MAKEKIIFILGGPGSGKGTYCQKIAQEFNCLHISAGDCLREAINDDNCKYKNEINSCIAKGEIVPNDITIELLLSKIMANNGKCTKILIDGYPRNYDNLNGWLDKTSNRIDVVLCIYLECDYEIMEMRIHKRKQLENRSDDNDSTLKKRFDTYKNHTIPIINYFDKLGILYKINTNEDITTNWAKIEHKLRDKMNSIT